MKKVVIIGGGVSGIICAHEIKKELGNKVDVIIVERLDRIGKKILSTGNGKCNFTNINASPKNYNHPRFVGNILDKYSPSYVIGYFEEMGLLSKELSEGRIYPYTEAATTFLDVLRMRINNLGVKVITGFDVDKVLVKENKFIINNKLKKNDNIVSDYVVFSCGGSSSEVLGSNGSGYNLVKPYKIKCSNTTPGLVGLKSPDSSLRALNGLRYKCMVSLINKKTKEVDWSDYGEVQFKADGVSGIVIMDASSIIGRSKESYNLVLDLVKEKTEKELLQLLNMRKELFKDEEMDNFLTGMLPKMLAIVLLKKAKIDLEKKVSDIKDKEIKKIVKLLKEFNIDIKGDYGFDKSQVTVGGIEISEIDGNSLELKKLPNSYITGEMMDIDGTCGGYNMQWALASGLNVAGAIIGKLAK